MNWMPFKPFNIHHISGATISSGHGPMSNPSHIKLSEVGYTHLYSHPTQMNLPQLNMLSVVYYPLKS